MTINPDVRRNPLTWYIAIGVEVRCMRMLSMSDHARADAICAEVNAMAGRLSRAEDALRTVLIAFDAGAERGLNPEFIRTLLDGRT